MCIYLLCSNIKNNIHKCLDLEIGNVVECLSGTISGYSSDISVDIDEESKHTQDNKCTCDTGN